MVSTSLNLLVKFISNYTYLNLLGKKPRGKMSRIISDVVSNLASMRMMFLVCSSGQSNCSALMVFSSSVTTANS